ncbi:hypothetical protein MU852_12030 [Brevundimonas albigilva]|uniref:hypothetical protein n=1 Tax=Brevundimonas albigilva TaxID=1312364 RepID=UPI00201B76DE|nr:hypothetical protein [Brevundimonas albigilva]UQV17576.1 hypothetical protein MU852_12030 [Brevundimonas albigilva]
MDLVERYLKAVAAQLPKETREDIVAELRDDIMGRIEDLEARLGRAPTDDEVEALLREAGHPLTVAARYRPGPQALIGPELYPWWLFGVKVGLTVMACVTLIGLAARVLAGDVYPGQAIGQGVASLFSGAVSIIGILTVAGFILERQAKKPDFIAKWRVKDLGLFELGGNIDADDWSRKLSGDWSEPKAKPGPAVKESAEMSPVARAVASAIGWTVVLLWWTGLLPVMAIRPRGTGRRGRRRRLWPDPAPDGPGGLLARDPVRGLPHRLRPDAGGLGRKRAADGAGRPGVRRGGGLGRAVDLVLVGAEPGDLGGHGHGIHPARERTVRPGRRRRRRPGDHPDGGRGLGLPGGGRAHAPGGGPAGGRPVSFRSGSG